MYKYVLAGACILSAPLAADFHPDKGSWAGTVEYLIMEPSIDDTYFVIQEPNNLAAPPSGTVVLIDGEQINNDFSYCSGVRLSAIYALPEGDRELRLVFTNLNASHNKSVSGSNLVASQGIENNTIGNSFSGAASSHLFSHYQRLEGLFAQKFYYDWNVDLRMILGFEYADMKTNQAIIYAPDSITNLVHINQNAKTWGVGPEVGFTFDYELCRLSAILPSALSFNVFSTASLLIGESGADVEINYAGGDITIFDVTNENKLRITPALHMRVGFDYYFYLCNHKACVGLGYEFTDYINAISQIYNNSYFGNGFTRMERNDYYVQGLYLSLACAF